MTRVNEIEAELATALTDLERTLAFQWGVATGLIRPGADVEITSMSKSVTKFKAAVRVGLKKSGTIINRVICDNLDYCKHKNAKQVEAVIALLDAKVILLTGLPVPAVRVACYAVKAGILDDMCGCKKPKARPKIRNTV